MDGRRLALLLLTALAVSRAEGSGSSCDTRDFSISSHSALSSSGILACSSARNVVLSWTSSTPLDTSLPLLSLIKGDLTVRVDNNARIASLVFPALDLVEGRVMLGAGNGVIDVIRFSKLNLVKGAFLVGRSSPNNGAVSSVIVTGRE